MEDWLRKKQERQHALIKQFCNARGWRHKGNFSIGALVPGRKNDWQFSVPDQDHVESFYEDCKGGKPIAFVSQPYDHAKKEEMVTWAAKHGLRVEFPDEPAFHNDQCMLCVFTRDYDSTLWKAVERLGETWVAKNLAHPFHDGRLIEPEHHGDYVERYQHSAEQRGIKTIRTSQVLWEPIWTRIFIWPSYRALPLGHLTGNMIKAIIEAPGEVA